MAATIEQQRSVYAFKRSEKMPLLSLTSPILATSHLLACGLPVPRLPVLLPISHTASALLA